ncbi:S-layer homology domain-containing protein [Xylanibacillus composti]|uniref:SLH domain-containing protein n=1 Tax=Xylanibacillus composti TaxID=1572762 RepID=A0A8J4H7F9_9BACL|nr:S-layer homology domain-containing protein [Xylanibacillus composti]GIQ70359.1 hypothetical protein XYCOK13_31830 [Xylanibacillus composti]
MKRQWMSRVSTALVACMLIALLAPAAALAAAVFTQVTYSSNGTVTGTVYYDNGETLDETVTINVYGWDGAKIGVVEATYDREADGVRYYNFAGIPGDLTDNRQPIKLTEAVTGVTESVYAQHYHIHGELFLNGASKAGTTLTISGNGYREVVPYGTVTNNVYGASSVTDSVYANRLLYQFAAPAGTYTITAENGRYTASQTVAASQEGRDIGKVGNEYYWLVPAGNMTMQQPRGGGGPVGGGGGGGGISDSVSGGTITVYGDTVSANSLKQAFEGRDTVTILIPGDLLKLPAETLHEIWENNPRATIIIVSDIASYSLPLGVLKLKDQADALGTSLSSLTLEVSMKAVSSSTADAVAAAANKVGAELIGTPVEFGLRVVTSSGQSRDIRNFGNTYVERSLFLDEAVSANRSTGVVYHPATESVLFVPSVFETADGKSTAVLKRNTNSIYAVVTSDKQFNDVPDNHYAKDDITKLANKLVVFGTSDTAFETNRNVTRAEFAALLVRSLAIEPQSGRTSFSDVVAGSWYEPEVKAATEAGLIYGYPDGTFRPNAVISRQELAAMVVRAMAYAGKGVELTDAQVRAQLAGFTDANQVGGWAVEEMAVAIQSRIVYGMNATTLAPHDNATRAQAAAMISRYLGSIGFID